MTRDEVLATIEQARRAIDQYKREGLAESYNAIEQDKVRRIKEATARLMVEAKTIGAAGSVCPACQGSGRV